jgi:hypothetical protein
VAVIWAGIVGVRLGARLLGARWGWQPAMRLAAFVSATNVIITPLVLAVLLLAPAVALPTLLVMVAIEAAYTFVAMRPIYGLGGGRRAGATATTIVMQYLLAALVLWLLYVLVVVLLKTTGNLTLPS